MALTHTLTQTHRHFIDSANTISVTIARKQSYPLIAECGQVWIPGAEKETSSLPMCPDCEANSRRGLRRDLSEQPHYVYRIFDAADRLIYVGCTVNPVTRMDQHRKNSWWFDQGARTRYVVFGSRGHALERENEAIANERPRWNRRGRWPHRLTWTVDDYRDYHTTLIRNGSSQTQHIAKVVAEAGKRYGLTLEAAAS